MLFRSPDYPYNGNSQCKQNQNVSDPERMAIIDTCFLVLLTEILICLISNRDRRCFFHFRCIEHGHSTAECSKYHPHRHTESRTGKHINTGNVAGAEVVQCYYETLYASVVRPKKELVRFQKVFLKPGEKKDVDFFIDQEEFSYYGKNMETVSGGMKLRISIGNSSDHLVSENIIQA